ncbi:MAG: hypothetical protein Aurels2KO_47300 [Aureliella sp.]
MGDGEKVHFGIHNILLLLFTLLSAPAAAADERFIPTRDAVFSPDGKLLACSYGGIETPGALRVWEWRSDKLVLEHNEARGICSVAFSPAGDSVAFGTFGLVGKTLDLKSGQVTAEFRGHEGAVRAVAYVSNDILATGSYDKTIRLWNAKSGKQLARVGEHSDELRSIAVSPDGRYLVSGSKSPDCRLWDLVSMQQVGVYDSPNLICPQVLFSSTGRYFLGARWNHQVAIRDADSRALRSRVHLDAIFGIALSPDDSFLLGLNDSPYLQVADLRLGGANDSEKAKLLQLAKLWADDNYKVREQASRDVEAIGSVAIPILNRLARMKNAEIRYRAREAREQITQAPARQIDVGHERSIYAAGFSPDNVHIATGDSLGTVKIWKYRTEEVVKTIDSPNVVLAEQEEATQ